MENKQVVTYNVTDAAIAEMSEMYMGLVITDLEDKEQFGAVHSARMVVRKKRVEVDKTRKELKADALRWGKAVQDEANRIFALIEPIETHLKNEEGKAETEKRRLDDERIAGVNKLIDRMQDRFWVLNGTGTVEQLRAVIAELDAIEIVPEIYFEFTADAFRKRDEILATTKDALEQRERLDREEAELKAENERLAIERKKQEEEAARLQKIADEQAAMLKKQQDILDENERKIKAERDALEAEKRAEKERKDREEFEKKAEKQAEEEAAKKALEKAAYEIRMEKEALQEAARQEALKPEKEKMIAFAQFLQEGVIVPVVSSDRAAEILMQASKDIYDVGEYIIDAVEKM